MPRAFRKWLHGRQLVQQIPGKREDQEPPQRGRARPPIRRDEGRSGETGERERGAQTGPEIGGPGEDEIALPPVKRDQMTGERMVHLGLEAAGKNERVQEQRVIDRTEDCDRHGSGQRHHAVVAAKVGADKERRQQAQTEQHHAHIFRRSG